MSPSMIGSFSAITRMAQYPGRIWFSLQKITALVVDFVVFGDRFGCLISREVVIQKLLGIALEHCKLPLTSLSSYVEGKRSKAELIRPKQIMGQLNQCLCKLD